MTGAIVQFPELTLSKSTDLQLLVAVSAENPLLDCFQGRGLVS